jgi:hypothetical protein
MVNLKQYNNNKLVNVKNGKKSKSCSIENDQIVLYYGIFDGFEMFEMI